jgi:hypothetical protein
MTDAHAHTSSAGEEDDLTGGKDRARNQAQVCQCPIIYLSIDLNAISQARAKRHEARAKRAETPASSDA